MFVTIGNIYNNKRQGKKNNILFHKLKREKDRKTPEKHT